MALTGRAALIAALASVPVGIWDPSWTGIKDALDDRLKGSTRFTFLGKAARSAYLRAT